MKANPAIWVTGRHSVEELLRSQVQEARKVLLSALAPPEVKAKVERMARERSLPCLVCSKEEWERRTGEREGGGVAAEIAEFRYADLEDWISSLSAVSRAFLLDGVTDPQNLGAILRSARAFSFDGVVIPADRSCPVTAAVFRASAGAAAHVPVIQVKNLVRAIERLKEFDFWIYAAEGKSEVDLAGFQPAKRTAVVLGSEEKGIRRLALEKCDGTLRIGMASGMDSLNVSVAAGIFAFTLAGSGESR